MSVGHVARVAEEAGIPTVGVYVKAFEGVAKEMSLPRVLVTRHPVGRPLGAPGDADRQRAVLLAALELLEKAPANGTVRELEEPYRPGPVGSPLDRQEKLR
ncbi:MAG: hypothetical protein SCH98_05595 [Deferrisomatales bacterium]|nr:hypothetical protein [Deferrisomatales bacterium]